MVRAGGPSGFRSVAGVGIYFASNGFVFAALLPWYPLMIDRLGVSSWEFGLIVACFAAGALLSSVLPARLIARFGGNAVVLGGTVLLGLAVAATAWSVNGVMMAVCLLLLGCFDAIVDVAQNVVGITVQERLSRTILSSMHALWSLGGLISGAAATVAASAGMDMRLYLAIIAVIAVAMVVFGRRLIGDRASSRRLADSDSRESGQDPAAQDPAAQDQACRDAAEGDTETNERAANEHGTGGVPASSMRMILLLALPLAVVAICGAAVEDIANNWAALAAAQLGGIPVASAGVAFSIVIGSQCLGRFSGDLLVTRFGPGSIARLGGGLIAVGGIAVATAVEPVVLLSALAAIGFGSATLVPGALGAAAHLPGVGRAGGVTLVNWMMRVGFLGTSPLLGVIATGASLRWGLSLLVVIGVLTMVFSNRLNLGAPTER